MTVTEKRLPRPRHEVVDLAPVVAAEHHGEARLAQELEVLPVGGWLGRPSPHPKSLALRSRDFDLPQGGGGNFFASQNAKSDQR